MPGAEHPVWHDFYKNAVMETDPEKQRMRIAAAYKAIRARVAEIRCHGLPHAKERSQLDCALYFLHLLHGFTEKKQSPAPARVPELETQSNAA